jgi:hypothetical protein
MSYKKIGIVSVGVLVLGFGIYGYLNRPSQASIDEAEGKAGSDLSQERSMSPVSEQKSAPNEEAKKSPATAPSLVSANGKVTAEQFAKKVETTLENLITVEQYRAAAMKNVHTTPREMIQAGAQIGDIAEMMEENPEFLEQGMQFYEKCMEGNTYPTPIRALCYSNLKQIHADRPSLSSASVPEDVKRLGDQL